MKIALLTPTYPPMISGASLLVQHLAERLATSEIETLVLTASDRPQPYRRQTPHLTVERCRSFHNPLRVGQRFALWSHGAVQRRLADFAPQLIHLHEPFQLALGGLAYARRAGIPVVITVNQLPWFVSASLPLCCGLDRLVENSLWAYARWLLRRCSAVVVPSHTIARLVAATTGVQPLVISNGVALEHFQPRSLAGEDPAALRRRVGLPPDVPILLHVGRLDVDKRVDRVVRAAARAMQQTPAHLLVIGDGTERGKLAALSEELGIARRCHFPGFITVEQGLPAFYRLASVFVTASEIETQGIVLLEAAASGLPLVAANATCISEIVKDGINGWLALPGDIEGLSRGILGLLADTGLRQEMGLASLEIAQLHAMQCTFAAYQNLYARVEPAFTCTALQTGAAPDPAARSGVCG